jgi:hypothetical protein
LTDIITFSLGKFSDRKVKMSKLISTIVEESKEFGNNNYDLLSPMQQFYYKKSVFMTGATGFLGKGKD